MRLLLREGHSFSFGSNEKWVAVVQSGLSCCDRATDEVARHAEEYDERNRRKTHGNGA